MRGRAAFEAGNWRDAHALLAEADGSVGLEADDLWRLGLAAHLLGNAEEFEAVLQRAYQSHQDAAEFDKAAYCAFWLGFSLMDRGQVAPGSGWMARAQRLVEAAGGGCVTEGYLLLPRIQSLLGSGSFDEAYGLAGRAAALASEYDDRGLLAMTLHAQGLARLRQCRLEEAFALLDEALLAIATDELMPILTGIIYCSAISACLEVYSFDRAQQWTAALSDWCEGQPGLVLFRGACMANRAQIMGLHGSWEEAYSEARLAEARCLDGADQPSAAVAAYVQAEMLRLQGRFEEAERAYERAVDLGRDPQPGLALMRSAQGRHGVAAAALRRALRETSRPGRRARLLAGMVEVATAQGELEEASGALAELAEIARQQPARALDALVAWCRGAIQQGRGDAAGALDSLRFAWREWLALEAPYEAARARELLARACEALGDRESARLEFEAARKVYLELGASPDAARLSGSSATEHGLTGRELEVLRLVAAGKTNKRIAADLGLSVRTVERHLSNIFTKLELSSRSAATAYAFEHGLTADGSA